MYLWSEANNLLNGFENLLNSGDPEVRSWFLVRNNYLPFILCGCYVLFATTLGPAFMKNREPFNLRRIMVFFNLFLVSIYGTFLLLLLFCLPFITKEMFCYGVDVKGNYVSYVLARAGWLIYIVKYIEFFDTAFFILRKKEYLVSFLHVSHHTIVPLFAWFIIRTENSGLQFTPAIINSIVHFIMYSYYGLAAMGPRVRKYLWWKKYLTQLQMAQMVGISIFITVFAPLTGCKMVLSNYILDSVIFPFYFYLFYRFYKTSFKSKTKSEDKCQHSEKQNVQNELNGTPSAKKELPNEEIKKQK